jgi:hypothetical protein
LPVGITCNAILNIFSVYQFYQCKRSIPKRNVSSEFTLNQIIMSDQNSNQYSQNQHQETTPEPNDTHESTSKTDKAEGVGENDENHTSGDHIQYQKEGQNSQQSSAGQDGKEVHTDNQGGTTSE